MNQTIDDGKCEKLLGIDLLILTFNVYTDNIFRELELKLNVLLTNIIWEINHNLLIQMWKVLLMSLKVSNIRSWYIEDYTITFTGNKFHKKL